jgi:hypothetical protein
VRNRQPCPLAPRFPKNPDRGLARDNEMMAASQRSLSNYTNRDCSCDIRPNTTVDLPQGRRAAQKISVKPFLSGRSAQTTDSRRLSYGRVPLGQASKAQSINFTRADDPPLFGTVPQIHKPIATPRNFLEKYLPSSKPSCRSPGQASQRPPPREAISTLMVCMYRFCSKRPWRQLRLV